MLKNRQIRYIVHREFHRADKRDFGPELSGHLGYLLILGADNKASDVSRPFRLADRVGDQRLASQEFDVLPGDAFRAAPRGNYSKYFH
jgi:hypothetical protein